MPLEVVDLEENQEPEQAKEETIADIEAKLIEAQKKKAERFITEYNKLCAIFNLRVDFVTEIQGDRVIKKTMIVIPAKQN
jgi:hypothetical protein